MVSVEEDTGSAGTVPEPVAAMIDGSACRRSMDLDQQTDIGEVQSVFATGKCANRAHFTEVLEVW